MNKRKNKIEMNKRKNNIEMNKRKNNIEVRTITTLTVSGLLEALETGLFTDKKIKNVKWLYEDKMVDAGRGNPTYERVLSGVEMDLI